MFVYIIDASDFILLTDVVGTWNCIFIYHGCCIKAKDVCAKLSGYPLCLNCHLWSSVRTSPCGTVNSYIHRTFGYH